jgi:metal-responsive CopG/Arc/MetJ family transcriptional regulator
MNMPREGFSSIAVPTELYEELDRYVKKNPKLGYTGVPEFVREILRAALAKGAA